MLYKYKAFISYSRKDSKFANELFEKLELYNIPAKIKEIETNKKDTDNIFQRLKDYLFSRNRLGKFFLDVAELNSDPNLNNRLYNELKKSEFLIVICSPNSGNNSNVSKEIKYFKALNGDEKIIPIIIDGIINATNNSLVDSNYECYPESLRFDVDNSGELTNIEKNPSGIDFRVYGKKKGKINLISNLLSIDFNDLWDREYRRFRKILFLWTIFFCTFFFIFLFLANHSYKKHMQIENIKSSNLNSRNLIIEIENIKKELLSPTIRDMRRGELEKKLQKKEHEQDIIKSLQSYYSIKIGKWGKEAREILKSGEGINAAINYINSPESKEDEKNVTEELADKYRVKAMLYLHKNNYNNDLDKNKNSIVYKSIEAYAKGDYYSNTFYYSLEYAQFLLTLGQYNKAKDVLLKLHNKLKINKNTPNFAKNYSAVLSYLSKVYMKENKTTKMLQFQEEAYLFRKNLFLEQGTAAIRDYFSSIDQKVNYFRSINNKTKELSLLKLRLKIGENNFIKEKRTLDKYDIFHYANSLVSLASFYKINNDNKKALVFNKKALEIYKIGVEKYEKSFINSYTNTKSSIIVLEKYNKKRFLNYEKDLSFVKKAYLNNNIWRKSYLSLLEDFGAYYKSQNSKSNVIKVYTTILNLTTEDYLKDKDNFNYYIIYLRKLSVMYVSIQNKKMAIDIYNEAFQLTKKHYLKDRININLYNYRSMINSQIVFFKSIKEFDKVIFLHKEYLKYFKTSSSINRFKSFYKSIGKEKEAKELEKELAKIKK